MGFKRSPASAYTDTNVTANKEKEYVIIRRNLSNNSTIHALSCKLYKIHGPFKLGPNKHY